jgi:antitoxin (DNA-binding transcriptional repressor) of toxin-antitoxin stability system
MDDNTVSITARDAVHNFTHYAALVDAGAEVVIRRRGKASLKLVRVAQATTPADRDALIARALAIRSSKPFEGKFNRSEAYDE